MFVLNIIFPISFSSITWLFSPLDHLPKLIFILSGYSFSKTTNFSFVIFSSAAKKPSLIFTLSQYFHIILLFSHYLIIFTLSYYFHVILLFSHYLIIFTSSYHCETTISFYHAFYLFVCSRKIATQIGSRFFFTLNHHWKMSNLLNFSFYLSLFFSIFFILSHQVLRKCPTCSFFPVNFPWSRSIFLSHYLFQCFWNNMKQLHNTNQSHFRMY